MTIVSTHMFKRSYIDAELSQQFPLKCGMWSLVTM